MRSHRIEIPYEAPAGLGRRLRRCGLRFRRAFGPQRRRVGEIVYEEIEGVENRFLCIARDRKHRKSTMAAEESERLTVANRSISGTSLTRQRLLRYQHRNKRNVSFQTTTRVSPQRAEGAAKTKPKGLSRRPRPATSDKRGDRVWKDRRRREQIWKDRRRREQILVHRT